ncbi:MAG TPA: hypothetical protein VMC79_16490 [Rectinemataceae bacterium]|nr:hypothetical protein [Rectinemataceae bacterium]
MSRAIPAIPAIPARLGLVGLLCVLLSPGVFAAGGNTQGPSYRIHVSPERPRAGQDLELDILVDGLTAEGLDVAELAADDSLALESQIIAPHVEADGRRNAEIRLIFRVLRAGQLHIPRIVLRSKEGSLTIGPLDFGTGSSGSGTGADLSYWEWDNPAVVHQFESFSVALRNVGGEGGGDRSQVGVSLTVPAGASFEAAGSLLWTVTALEQGELDLPEAELRRGDSLLGRASPARISVRPLPPALETSRAIGNFELRLEGLDRVRPRAGEALAFRILLSGNGNLPLLRLPEPRILLDGALLPAGDIEIRRVDDSRPSRDGYEGRAISEIRVLVPAAGALTISLAPYSTMDRSGTLRQLTVQQVSLRVEGTSGPRSRGSPVSGVASGVASGGASGGAFPDKDAVAARLAAANPALRDLPDLLAAADSGDPDAATARQRVRALLTDTRVRGPEAIYLGAALKWEAGDRAAALALLYGLVRAQPGFAAAVAAARFCSGELGSGPPLLDTLPSPVLFAMGGTLSLAGALILLVLSRRRKGVLGAAAALSLALAIVALGLAGISASERARSYAVVWTDRLLVVPSPRDTGFVDLVPGSAARVRGETAGYVALVFGDGLAGWAPRDCVYYY